MEATVFQQARQELITVRDFLRFAVSQFNQANLTFRHGTDNAHDEATYLIFHTLHLPPDNPEPYLDTRLLDTEKDLLIELLEQRVLEHRPVAYLTNHVRQGDFDFYIDERVSIPRSYLYKLLGARLTPWIKSPELIQNALNLCTGSGCLAIQMACHYPDAQIDVVDISLDALEVTAINIENYQLQDQISMIHTDLFEGMENSYDLIIATPPYIDASSIADLPDEYLYEPAIALGCSGQDELDTTRKIIDQAADYLNPNGVLLVEIGHNRDVLEVAYPQMPFTWLPTSGGDGFVFLLTKEELLSL